MEIHPHSRRYVSILGCDACMCAQIIVPLSSLAVLIPSGLKSEPCLRSTDSSLEFKDLIQGFGKKGVLNSRIRMGFKEGIQKFQQLFILL